MANLQKIKDLADLRKISIRELAERVGLKENQIHVMCRTNSTKIDTLERIAKELGVTVSYFFDEEEKVEIRQAGHDYVEKGKIEHHGTEYNAPVTYAECELEKENAELKQKLIEAQERIIKLLEKKR